MGAGLPAKGPVQATHHSSIGAKVLPEHGLNVPCGNRSPSKPGAWPFNCMAQASHR
ncbi:protein of unknown function [Pseudomonas sp. JV551A1]|uniref:Uncharacterized protein n=1 Tax=Pseudomonas inefficax TaxID=2078786 RepID=A0AAQ1SW15_9PSED|nr:protein of unknown function [Pseudomonas sp. JV551A1]SPO63605.1 protein of unknown function [Pseudomonas inefficax]